MNGLAEDTIPQNDKELESLINRTRKRKFSEDPDDESAMGQKASLLSQPELPEFNLTVEGQSPNLPANDRNGDAQVSPIGDLDHPKKKAKKIPKPTSSNYPAIDFGKEARLSAPIKISDLQGLVLYILANGAAPQFVSVRHRPEIRKVVVLMVPGLEAEMFRALTDGPAETLSQNEALKETIYPKKLEPESLPIPVRQFADMFDYMWPVKTPGDDKWGKMHSALHAMLTAPIPKNKEEKSGKGIKPVQEPAGWKNEKTSITEFIQTPEDLLENEYVLHPAAYDDELERSTLLHHRKTNGVSVEDGWVDTLVQNFHDGSVPDNEIEAGSITAGREVLAMDCEMCKTGDKEFSLTRISIVDWNGTMILDELVKPDKPITDYLTMYSGISEGMLAPVTTTLKDIQVKLLKILHPRTILIGHSLNSDMTALKMTHPYIIDTALLYPHPRGPPLKSSLKWLAKKYLNREVQKGHGMVGIGAGHDSIEDSVTCLDLVKQKCERGKNWGTSEATGENIFKRVARTGVRYKNQGQSLGVDVVDGRSSAAIDWGDPRRGAGAAANFVIGCQSDEGVMEGVIRAVKGDPDGKKIPGGGADFVWARFRELEALKGWWNNNKMASPEESIAPIKNPPATEIDTAAQALTKRLFEIHAALPPCTAFIIYSGSGDPREMSRLQSMQLQFKREYKVKKWDDLSIKWTDTEEQALKQAARSARNGIGFIGMK